MTKVEIISKMRAKLKKLEPGSEEYNAVLEDIQKAQGLADEEFVLDPDFYKLQEEINKEIAPAESTAVLKPQIVTIPEVNEDFQDKADEKEVEQDIVVEKKSTKDKVLDVIGDINIYKGTTIKDIVGDDDDEKEIEILEETEIELPTADPDATAVAKGNIPEIIEDETFSDDEYFDTETNTIKSDFTIEDALIGEEEDDRDYVVDIDGNKIYLESKEEDKKVEEVVESGDPADDLWVNKAVKHTVTGLKGATNFVVNITKTLYDLRNKNEREELLLETKKVAHNIPLNLKQAYYSTKLVTNKWLTSLDKINNIRDYDGINNLALMDIEGGNLGFSTENPLGLDNSTFEYDGGIQWISPGGEVVDLDDMRKADRSMIEETGVLPTDIANLQKLVEERKANGWKVIYKRSGREVGHKYKAWQLSQFQKIIEIEAKKIKPEVSFVQGYKQKDASQFIGAGMLAVSSLIETMLPAIVTRGASLYPQIVTPKYVEYNREKAMALYPDLPESEAIDKLLDKEQDEVLIPLTIGFIEMSLEKIGIKGITKAIKSMSPGAMKFVSNVAVSGSREGITEWSQLGTTIINRELGKGKSLEEATRIAWIAMSSEEGLENFLLGLVGGSFATTSGAIINRALRMDPSSIAFVNQKIQEIVWVKSRQITSEEGKKAVQRKIDKIIKELIDHVEVSKKLQRYLSKEEKARLVELVALHNGLRYDYESARIDFLANFEINGKNIIELASEEGISPTEYLKKYYPDMAGELKLILNDINDQTNAIHAQIEDIKNVANERLIDTGIDVASKTIGSDRVVVFNTAEELETWLKENEKDLKDPKNAYRNADGWEIGDGNIYINKPVAIEIGAISVAQHETAHFLFGDKLRDSKGDLTAEGIKIINDFINTLPANVFATLTMRLEANYNLKDPNVLEEYLTHYIDGIIKEEWKPSNKSLKVLGDAVTSIMNENGYETAKFETAQDVLEWLNGYVKQKGTTEDPIKRKEPKPGGAKTRFSETNLKPPVDKLGQVDKATWDASGANNAITFVFGKLDNLIGATITQQMREGENWTSDEDYIQGVYLRLIPLIRSFNPTINDSLWGWIVPLIRKKGYDVLKEDKVKPTPGPIPIDDVDSFVNEVESEEFVDLEMAIEEDVTFTELINILGIKRGGKLYKKIIEGVKTIIPLELSNLNTLDFKKNIQNYFKARFFDDIKGLIGTPGSQKYKDFITNKAEALYNLFPQSVFNKQFQDFIVKGKRLTVPETREAQDKGLVDKNLTPEQMADGIYLYTKLPFTEEVEQKWIDNFLNPPKGTPASKQNSLLDLMSWFLGFDATMEVINSEEFLRNNDIAEVTIATIGMKIDRGANVRFSNTNGNTRFLNSNNFDPHQAGIMARWVGDNIGFDEVSPEELDSMLRTEFPGVSEETRDLIVMLADTQAIINKESKRYKAQIANDPDISQNTKDQIKEDGAVRYNLEALEKIYNAAVIVAPQLGPEIMDVIGYEILGFINRVLNSAERQKNPDYETDKTQPKYLINVDGDYISAPYYDKLQKLKEKVEKSKVKLPEGLVLKDIRLMNKKFLLFKKIEKILFDGDSKIDGSNIKWKQAQIAKLSAEIDAAGRANLILAKHIAKVMIESGIDQATLIHILQIQTSIISGFRALTSLDLITILEGSQEPGIAHPYFQAELELARKAKNKKGELKYPTEELAVEAAIKALGTKGEHAAANANTMAKIANLHARYLANPNIDLDLELSRIFEAHGQIHGTKGTFTLFDVKGGTTNSADWLRAMLDPRREDMYSPGGLTAEEIVVQKIAPKTRFSNTNLNGDFNIILEQNEGVRRETIYSDAKGKIEGGSKKNFWNLIFPPSAYDFELFIYRIIGKDKKGKEDLAWFKKHLFDPYDVAYKKIQDDAQRVADEYKALIKRLPKVKKNLKNTIPGTKFTYEQALRVSIWTDMGLKIPGLSKTDLGKLLKAIDNDPKLTEFKNELKNVLVDNYPPPTDYWTIESIAYDLDQSINTIARAKHLETWKKNRDIIFSKENRAKLEAIYGPRYVESLDNMLHRMEYARNKKSVSRIESNWNRWVNNSVGAIMFFNFRSATLQTISALNFIDWENNTPWKAAKQFANIVRYRKNFVKILFSSYLKQRRSGGKRTVNEAELTEYLKGKKNWAKAALAWLLEKGFMPTAAADSLAIAVGGATYLANQEDFYISQGMSIKEAEALAWIDFQSKAEKGQQSSRPDLLSEQQAGGLGRLILAFKNTQQQYFRIMTKAVLDIKNKRGSLKSNMSKIAYYAVLQNALFASLQTALFAAFDDDEEWDKKTDRVAQNMIDSVIAGLGLTGSVIVTVKNGILTYVKQKEKGFSADHTRTIIEFANLSPTIGSKLRKLYSAIRTEQLNQDAIDEMGLDINSPAVNSIASLISAATNIPVDRAVTITQNLILASTDEADFNQSLALVLGWSAWDIGLEPVSRKVQQEAKKKRKKLMEELKLMEKEKENLEKLKVLEEKGKKGFCAGAKKDGSDCGLPIVEGTSFCTVHQKVKERKDGKKVQCAEIKYEGTKKEKQCGVMTSAESGYCYYHD